MCVLLGRATKWLRRLVSPVNFSTDAHGKVHEGLGHLPVSHGRPVLYVGNHQTLALDIGFLIEDVIKERDILLRGLAHPAVFGVRLNRFASRSPGRCFDLSAAGSFRPS